MWISILPGMEYLHTIMSHEEHLGLLIQGDEPTPGHEPWGQLDLRFLESVVTDGDDWYRHG